MYLDFRRFFAFLTIVLVAGTASAQLTARTLVRTLGYPENAKLLIIHADDVGLSHSVNRASFEALERGWITSASIMVPCPGFPEAAAFARRHPEMDLGLHLTLTSEWQNYRWEAVDNNVASLSDKDGYLHRRERTLAAHALPEEAEQEIRAQIKKARAAGVHFTHFDTHMGTLFDTPELFRIYQEVARDYHVPSLIASQGSPRMRRADEAAPDMIVITRTLQIRPGVRHRRWPSAYRHMLQPLGPGIYQLIVHLGYDDPELEQITTHHPRWGARWRQSDLEVVRDPGFQQFIREEGFILIGWKDLNRAAVVLNHRAALSPDERRF
jgi:hypothetical protein